MKTTVKFFAACAAALVSLSSCEVEKLIQDPEEFTHTVTFIAENVDTKTTMNIAGDVVSFSFTDADKARIKVYENGIEGTVNTETSTVEGGKLSIVATFSGSGDS